MESFGWNLLHTLAAATYGFCLAWIANLIKEDLPQRLDDTKYVTLVLIVWIPLLCGYSIHAYFMGIATGVTACFALKWRMEFAARTNI